MRKRGRLSREKRLDESDVALEWATYVSEEIIRILRIEQRKGRKATWDNSEAVAAMCDLLHAMATRQIALERDPLCGPTDLAHEAFARLLADDGAWGGRKAFILGAGEAMRRICCDEARKRATRKRGGDWRRVPLDDDHVFGPAMNDPEFVLEVNDVLDELLVRHARSARVFELVVFGGLTEREIALLLGQSLRTVERDWQFAKAWVHSQSRDAGRPAG